MPLDDHAGIIGPLLVLAFALLALVMRLLVGPGRPAGDADYGLLRVAAVAADRAGAEVVCGLLARAGIRATVAVAEDGTVRVLVFPEDLERARAVVSGPPG